MKDPEGTVFPARDVADQARRVYGYFIYRLRPPDEAERLTRLTFEHARRAHVDPDQPPVPPEERLLAAAGTVIALHPRSRGSSRRVSPAPPGQAGETPGISPALTMAIGRLGRREREAVALRFGAELGVAEIAQLLDRSPAEVKQRIARGVRRLSEMGIGAEGSPRTRSAERPGPGGAEQGESKQGQAGHKRRRDAGGKPFRRGAGPGGDGPSTGA
jgi:DNA-directed RNA polymerase specialized sigma24 family protein